MLPTPFLVAVAGPQMFERATAKIKAAAAEENRQALMLFTVVASFLICNACRVAFKLNEVLNYDKVRLLQHGSLLLNPSTAFLPAAAGLILLLVVLGDLGGTIVLQKVGFLSKSPKNSCAWGSWGDSC